MAGNSDNNRSQAHDKDGSVKDSEAIRKATTLRRASVTGQMMARGHDGRKPERVTAASDAGGAITSDPVFSSILDAALNKSASNVSNVDDWDDGGDPNAEFEDYMPGSAEIEDDDSLPFAVGDDVGSSEEESYADGSDDTEGVSGVDDTSEVVGGDVDDGEDTSEATGDEDAGLMSLSELSKRRSQAVRGVSETENADDEGSDAGDVRAESESVSSSDETDVGIPAGDPLDGMVTSADEPQEPDKPIKSQLSMFSDAVTKFSEATAAEASDDDTESEDVKPKRPVNRRGGRSAKSDSPVQVRGVDRALFNLVRREFPDLSNSKALEAFIAKSTGRFDLITDEELRARAFKAASVDGTIAGLANEMRSLRRSIHVLRLESSMSTLASAMAGIDAPDGELSEALFVRLAELSKIGSAYDDAMASAAGRIPKGY